MQPQDPANPTQQPNPATPPPPAAAPTPSPSAPTGSQGNWQSPAAAAQPKNNKKMIMIIVGVVVGLAVIAGAAFGAMKMFGSSIKLETYQNDDFSVLVPEGYEMKEEQITEFKEPGPEETQSVVIAHYQELPQTLEESQLSEVRDTFRDQLQESAADFVTGSEEIENLKVEDTTFKGEQGILLTATMTKDGKKIGDIKLVAVINTTSIYMVGVGAHISDGNLVKETDKIINSFELKK